MDDVTATLDGDVLDFGEVHLPNWKSNSDLQSARSINSLVGRYGYAKGTSEVNLTFVRTWIRKHRRGQVDTSGYRVTVVFPGGDIETWEFDTHVGFPVVDGTATDSKFWREGFE